MTSSATQIPLHLNPQQYYQLDNFYFSQQELQSVVEQFSQQKSLSFLYVWGDHASGKTHLAIAIAEQAQAHGKQVQYLPLAELVETASPDIFQAVESLDMLCLDQLEAIAGLHDWEEALFHCFNALQTSACQLLVTSKVNPASVELKLADLRSRLATGLIYQLESLDDTRKQHVLQLQAKARGLVLSNDVAQYLLRHYSRDLKALMDSLLVLDQASMAAKRRLTIPFVKQVIQDSDD